MLFIFLSFIFPTVLETQLPLVDLLPLLTYFLYYFLFEYCLGKTPGKYLTKTIVIDYYGELPRARRVFIRTSARLIPFDLISYLFALIGMHDLLSKTMVVKRKKTVG